MVAVVFGDGEGGMWLHRVRYLAIDRDDPADEATQQCRQVARFLREMRLGSVGMETNGLGRFLPKLLDKELAEQGVPAAVVSRSSSRPKHERIIEAFDALLAAGALHAHRSVWDTPFVREMREWRPGGGRSADDGLDAVAGCLLAEPVRLGPVRRPSRGPDWRGVAPAEADTAFEV